MPKGFVTVASLLAGEVKAGSFVDVVGMVKDHQMPTATTRDWKSSITIRDLHVEEDQDGIKLNIFRPEERDMPQEVDPKDVFVALKVKVRHLVLFLSL